MSVLPARQVTLVLCLRDGTVLGALQPYRVQLPYWQEVGGVVAGARARYGVDVTVLRLLTTAEGGPERGGAVTYLAEVAARPVAPLAPCAGDPAVDEPLRQRWARPGGPDDDLAWADRVLDERGTPRSGPARQVRTWNLSSLWRLPTDDGGGAGTGAGGAWLKVVPPFFAHEGAMLGRLDPSVVPRLLGEDGPSAVGPCLAGSRTRQRSRACGTVAGAGCRPAPGGRLPRTPEPHRAG